MNDNIVLINQKETDIIGTKDLFASALIQSNFTVSDTIILIGLFLAFARQEKSKIDIKVGQI